MGSTVTATYMHDGRFASLEEVVEPYDSGIRLGAALDRRVVGPDGSPLRLSLTDQDKAAVVAFLRTLRDTALLSDPRFSHPFKRQPTPLGADRPGAYRSTAPGRGGRAVQPSDPPGSRRAEVMVRETIEDAPRGAPEIHAPVLRV